MNLKALLTVPAIFMISGCAPDELKSFDHYLLNPDELADAVDFCTDSADRQAYADYCKTIDEFNTRYNDIEDEFNTQETLYMQYRGFYPEIDKKAEIALAEAKRQLNLKREGLKR